VAVVKVYFRPTANIPTAIAQVTAISQHSCASYLRLNAAASHSIHSIERSDSAGGIEQQDFARATTERPGVELCEDATDNGGGRGSTLSLRWQVAPGIGRFGYGGDAGEAYDAGRRGQRYQRANLILPSGTAKLGALEHQVELNASPQTIAELNDLPVRTTNGTTIYVRDVAHVRDGYSPQTNIVRQDGIRGTLLTIQKNGGASTIDIVSNIRAMLPQVAQTLPEDVQMTPLFDQSLFVRAAIEAYSRKD